MSAADISRKEKYSRCVALEEDYVHNVYERIGKELAQAKDPMNETVRQFLNELEPGSLVADIGCGNGKHLQDKDGLFSVGAERSSLQASLARQSCQEVLLGDNLRLPFRSNSFDAALSVDVLHHFTTRERRIEALKEISRILKFGGRALITVQRHNNKISQDVLIPWFDVPKTKQLKDDESVKDGNFEYECNRDEDEDDDSISLPSSDEEDYQWMNNAKFFPPTKYTADCRWKSESTTASTDVPNKLQTVQNNTCYAFVQRAFKRFSEENDTSDGQYCEPQFDARDNSSSQVNNTSKHDQKVNLSNASSFNLDENLLMTISDNFIELLNIDNDDDTSKLNTSQECYSGCLSTERSKLFQHRTSIIRSLSDIFKNMNSIWTSKSTKSCYDLKSLSASNIYAAENEYNTNRLVRSRTVTTCMPEFERTRSINVSKESKMTVNEAVQIINGFLDSSAPRIQTVQSVESGQINDNICHSDIVNGNTLPLKHISVKSDNLNLNDKLKDFTTSSIKKMPVLKEENLKCKDCLYDQSQEEKLNTCEKGNFNFYENTQKFYVAPQDSFINSDRNSKAVTYNSDKICSYDKLNCKNTKEEKYTFDRDLLEAKLRKEYSFLYDDESDEDEEEIIENSDVNGCKRKGALFKRINIFEDNDLETSLFDNESFYCYENVDFETFENRTILKSSVEESSNRFNMNNNSAFYGKYNSMTNKAKENSFTKSSAKPNEEYSNLELEDEFCEFDCCIGAGSSHSKCYLDCSPKKRRKTNHSENEICSAENTLGPFYDEDNDCTYTNIDFPLASYYSMPELHALSEFYDEYILYQNYLLDKLTPELLNYKYSYLKINSMQPRRDNVENESNITIIEQADIASTEDNTKSANEIQTVKLLDNNSGEIKTNDENKIQTLDKFHSSQKFEKEDLKECSLSDSSIENMKRELCNNIQAAFTSKNSYFIENNFDNAATIPEITLKDEKDDVPFPFQIKRDSFADLDDQLTSKFCLNNKKSATESYNSSMYFQSLGISRSCSSLLENANFNKLIEIPSLSNISASQPSLEFSPKKELRLNLNKYRLNQINLYHSLSSDILADEDIFSNFLKRTSVENIYCKLNTCALKELKKDTDETVRIVSNILEQCPHQVSYISSSNSNEIKTYSSQFNEYATNDKLLSNSQLLTNSNNSIDIALNNEKLPKLKNFRNSDNFNITDSYSKNSYFSTQMHNHKHSESFNSNKNKNFQENCACSSRDLENIEQKIKEFSDEALTESVKCVEHTSTSGTSLKNATNTIVAQEHSPYAHLHHHSLHCFTENISKTEQETSLVQVRDSVQGKTCTEDSILKNNVVPTDSKASCNISSVVVDNLNQTVVHSAEVNVLEDLHSICIDSADEIDHDYSLQKTGIEGECPHYTYGRIHEDGAAAVTHRYHHLFQEEELYDLIENNISDLHVLDSFVQELHLCIIAEKLLAHICCEELLEKKSIQRKISQMLHVLSETDSDSGQKADSSKDEIFPNDESESYSENDRDFYFVSENRDDFLCTSIPVMHVPQVEEV